MTKIVFLLLPKVHLLDLAGPDQVFFEAADVCDDIRVEYCSVKKQVYSTSRLSLTGLAHFSTMAVGAGDYVFIPGTDIGQWQNGELSFENELVKWLRNAYAAGAHLCSICSGAFLLARTGLLDGKKATTHWKRTKQLKQAFPRVQVIDNVLFTDDQRLLTSAGLTAGIDLALYILGKIKGEHFSFRIAREMVVYIRRDGNSTQESVFTSYRNHLHSGIHKVQDYVQENIGRKLSLDRLAELACTSPRNLTRVFKKETGITVNYYITLVRKERLRSLEEQDYTRKEMATLCGLKSERQVIRLLKD